nr:uncharacterized protein LOC109413165 [Aedes albopictus]
MATTSACDRCAKTVKKNEEYIECMGFCKNVVHKKCENLAMPTVKDIQERSNVHWMCDECSKLMKICRFKSVVSSLGCVISTVIESQMNGLSELKAELSKNNKQVADVLNENNNQVAQLANIVNAATPGRVPNRERPSKRRREDSAVPNSNPISNTGTRSVASNAVLTVKPAPNLFWVYLSRFHPTVKEDVVEELVRDGLQTSEPIKVISLVKKGADLSSMNFISFKVGVPVELKDAALDPGTWPEGIVSREFEGQSKNTVWLPPTTTVSSDQALIDTPASTPFGTPIPVITPAPLDSPMPETTA